MMPDPSLYPSYVDLDPYVDVDRLKSLDGYIRERLERRLAGERDLRFCTGPFTLDGKAAKLPGSRMVCLARSERPDDYYDLDRTDLWKRSEEAEEFAELVGFIDTLPFAATGRMLIMYDPEGRAVTAHRDHDSADLCHEFVWFRTNLDKPFYMLEPGSGAKLYVESHCAWFDTANQFHGGDATGELAWSIRVDGRFTEAFRALMPQCDVDRARRPALWAAQFAPARELAK